MLGSEIPQPKLRIIPVDVTVRTRRWQAPSKTFQDVSLFLSFEKSLGFVFSELELS
jgi:hypothetical protein